MAAVTMKAVRAALDPEEPDYSGAARLGAGALPHLAALVAGDDPLLASKAAYLASLVKDAKAADVVRAAAASSDPTVRVAAAAAATNLSATGASGVLVELIDDNDAGVRKVARASVPARPVGGLATKLRTLGAERVEGPGGGGAGTGDEAEPSAAPIVTGLMPGESTTGPSSGEQAVMPGEQRAGMPGEQSKMPGE